MENRQVIINNNLISYVTAGKGEKSLIFLHGWRSSKEVWLPIAERMADCGYRLIFIDLPGFGASETPKSPYTLHDYAEAVRLFTEKLDLKLHAIIGHSFGARIAVKIAAEHPTTCEKMTLVASGGARKSSNAFKKGVAAALKPFFMPRFMTPLRKKIYTWMDAEDYLATPELQKTFVNIVNENLDPLLAALQTETLIVWGDKDMTAPLTYGEHMARHIPHAHLEIIKDAGHYCFSEQPDQFVALLEKYIDAE